MYPTRTFPLGRWAAESQLTPGAAHPHSDADSGRFRTDTGHRERGLGSQLIVSRRAPSGRRAYTPLLLESSWRPPRAGTSGTPGHLSAPSRVKLLALNRTWWPKPRCPGQIHLRSATWAPGNLHSGGTFPPRWSAGLRAQHPTSRPSLRLSPSETPGPVLPTTMPTQRKAGPPFALQVAPPPVPPRATRRPPVLLQCRHTLQLGQHQKSGCNDGTPRRSQSDSLLPDLQNRLPCPRSPDHALDFVTFI